MNKRTIDYLNRYIAELAKVSHQEQVYGTLSDWHVTTKPDLVLAVKDINTQFRLAGATQLQEHIATTAIGRLDGDMVIVSANPGYSDKPVAGNPGRASKNAMEDAYRSQSREHNAAFCREFFANYEHVCGGSSPYWTKVMRFLEVYHGRQRVADRRQLWAATSEAAVLGGLDLLPMHSTRDAITPHLHGPNAEPLLRKVALAALGMALRLSPKFLLITSSSGQMLMTDLLEGRDTSGLLAQATITPCQLDAVPPYNLIRVWDVSMKPGHITTIVTFPYQVFSGAFIGSNVGYNHADFASALKKLR